MNQGNAIVRQALPTVLSTITVQKPPDGKTFASSSCTIFTHANISHKNQMLAGAASALPTILSTEIVEKEGAMKPARQCLKNGLQNFSIKNQRLDGKIGHCAHSFPQNL
jgi:hypothetical protein